MKDKKTYVLKYVLKSLEVINDKEKEKVYMFFQMKKEILHVQTTKGFATHKVMNLSKCQGVMIVIM